MHIDYFIFFILLVSDQGVKLVIAGCVSFSSLNDLNSLAKVCTVNARSEICSFKQLAWLFSLLVKQGSQTNVKLRFLSFLNIAMKVLHANGASLLQTAWMNSSQSLHWITSASVVSDLHVEQTPLLDTIWETTSNWRSSTQLTSQSLRLNLRLKRDRYYECYPSFASTKLADLVLKQQRP